MVHVEGIVARGEFVRLAYQLGRDAATGALTLDETAPAATHRLYLRRGYLTAARLEGHSGAMLLSILRDSGAIDDAQLDSSLAKVAAGGGSGGRVLRNAGAISEHTLDAALRRQAELRLERLALAAGSYSFDPRAAAPPAHQSGRPFSLTAWARRHVEASFDSTRARIFAGELSSARLTLRRDLAPDPNDGDDTDRRILAALGTPRSLAEVAAAAQAPQLRLLAFLGFLRAIGALTVEAPKARFSQARTEASRLLGVAPGADAATVKTAFRRLARLRHPDMHPGADGDRRRALEAEFARLSSAYKSLTSHT